MSDLKAALKDATRLPFAVLVSRIERSTRRDAAVGGDGPFRNEAIQFRHDPSLQFHTSDISNAMLDDAGSRVELTTTFAGLTGSASPLPAMFVEALAHEQDEDSLQREFLDIFHHRFLSLFYRGLMKYDLPRSANNPQQIPHILRRLFALAGTPMEHAERLAECESALLLRLLPLLVTYPANAERLAVAIRDALHEELGDATVAVQELTGGHVPIAESARPRLGVDMRLGTTSTLGGRAPCPASGVAVRIESLRPEDCARLGPGGDRFAVLSGIALLFAPEHVRVTMELTPSHAPAMRLGGLQSRLKVNSWLGGRGRPKPIRFKAEPANMRKEQHAS